MHNATSKGQLSNAKLLLGLLICPIMAAICSSNGVTIWTVVFLALTLVCGGVVYVRARDMVRSVTGHAPSRHASAPTAAAPLAEPRDDASRGLFL